MPFQKTTTTEVLRGTCLFIWQEINPVLSRQATICRKDLPRRRHGGLLLTELLTQAARFCALRSAQSRVCLVHHDRIAKGAESGLALEGVNPFTATLALVEWREDEKGIIDL